MYGYGAIEDDEEPEYRSGGSSGNRSPRNYEPYSGRRYMGMLLASKPRRIFGGMLTYGPAYLAWYVPQIGGMGEIGEAMGVIVGYMYIFLMTPQHESQSFPTRNWMGTRVVSVRLDDDDRYHVYYPKNWQIYTRIVMVIFVDAVVGWISVLFSSTNRSWGDRVARTIVIREGEAAPEMPYAKPRKSFID